jgi:hypothetical protein
MRPSVLFPLTDFPGHFLQLVREMALRLRERDVGCVFAATAPYQARFKGVALEELGPVHCASDFLARVRPSAEELASAPYDAWATYATYARQLAVAGRHLNEWSSYGKLALFFREVFDRHPEIRLVWSEPPSGAFLCLAQAETERRRLPYHGVICARIPEHFNVYLDGFGTRLLPVPEGTPPLEDQAVEGPDYMRNPENLLARRSFASVLSGTPGKLLRSLQVPSSVSIETGDTRLWEIRAYLLQLRRKLRYLHARARGRFAAGADPGADRLAVLFPLQYRPEASSAVLARHLGDDEEVVRNIAFSLPPGARLYVKEHASAIGVRDQGFYRRIASFPNVSVLDIDFPLPRVLSSFDAVVVLTSTVGFEAIQLGVPAFVLGRVFYEDYPGATRIRSFEELDACLKALVRTGRTPDPEPLRRYRGYCFPGNFNYLDARILAAPNVERLLRPVWQAVAAPPAP